MSNLTKQAIRQAFMSLVDKQPIDHITVKDITDSCGISRNTFYYHYVDIPTLVEETFIEQAEGIIRRYPDIDSLEQALTVGAEFILQNRRAANHIINSSHRQIYEHCLMKVCRNVVAKYFDVAVPPGLLNDGERELMIDFYKCMSFGIIVDWCENDAKQNYVPSFHTLLELRRRMIRNNTEI